MKTTMNYCMLAALALSSLPVSAVRAEANGDNQGYVDLFDGESLDGWVKAEGEGVPVPYRGGEWRVVDGAITGHQKPPLIGTFLHTKKTYRDFELEIDINPDWGCDSGIWIRTNPKGQCIQIFVDYLPDGNVGFVFGQGTGGYSSMPWNLQAVEKDGEVVGVRAVDQYDGVEIDGLVYSAPARDFNETWRHGEFNTLKIRCTGPEPRITTWVNGVKMMEMDGATFKARKLGDMRKKNWDAPSGWKMEKVLQTTGGEGTIALQVHPGPRWNGTVRCKKIRIRELK